MAKQLFLLFAVSIFHLAAEVSSDFNPDEQISSVTQAVGDYKITKNRFMQELGTIYPTAIQNGHTLAPTPAPAPAPSPRSGGSGGLDCGGLCKQRCSLHSRQNVCTRACGTCCVRCKCVPPGTSGNREVCGKCYTDMTTHGNRTKCP